jgi:rhamnosyl/mannosyltransferase
LRILHIGKYFTPFRGGVETYLYDAIRAQARRGNVCAALVHDHESGNRASDERYDAAPGTWQLRRSGTLGKLFFTPISPGFRKDLKHLVREFRPDIIHAHLPNPSACWLLTLLEARETPLVVHWHSDVLTDNQGPAMRLLYQFYRPLEQRLLSQAAAIVATSESYLRTSHSLQDYPGKCHVVPLGLDAERVLVHAQAVLQDTPPPEGFEVLAVGRLTYYKGFGFLIRAIAQLEGVTLRIVGEGSLRRELEGLARQLGVEERVHFDGGLDDLQLAERLERCHCVCLPSTERTEAFGLVLLEAMAFGKPTISSRVEGSGMTWVVEENVTGLKVPPRNSGALAEAIDRLRNDPDFAGRLGEAGRRRFRKHFDIGPSVAALQRVYEAVIPGRAAP